ncbi:hypothetical protein M5K25_018755 [Dendrobium thyrsiflorum]|uniref:Uncharacterized protein n=1 Tax=Dendrobium thyrsiflorum TaxID=117978 RepID=A0ABD0UKB9_DENTH
MVEGMMMSPIKIPWFRRPGPSWSLVYLVRGGSRPNLTEGSLSATMGCYVQGYLVDLGWIGAIWRRTTQFRGPRVITVYPAVPFGGKTADFWNDFCVGFWMFGRHFECLELTPTVDIFVQRGHHRGVIRSWVLLKILAALQRRPRVGAASECVQSRIRRKKKKMKEKKKRRKGKEKKKKWWKTWREEKRKRKMVEKNEREEEEEEEEEEKKNGGRREEEGEILPWLEGGEACPAAWIARGREGAEWEAALLRENGVEMNGGRFWERYEG